MSDPLSEQLSGGDEEMEDQELASDQPEEAEDADAPESDDSDAAARAAARLKDDEPESDDVEGPSDAELDGDSDGDGDGAAPRAKAKVLAPAKVVVLDPQARDGLIRCLQARIRELDATFIHATEVAQKDTFYSRWPNVVSELRTQALKRLEELQRS